MARLTESREVLNSIHQKALKYAMFKGTYGTRSQFKPGKRIVSFAEECAQSFRR